MKIIIASDLFAPSIGGTETVTKNMAVQLSKKGHSVFVLAPSEKNKRTPYIQKAEGYSVVRIRSIGIPIQKDLRWGFFARKQVREFFAEHNDIAVVHCNNPFPLSRTVLKVAKKRRIPVVMGSHLMPESVTFGLRRIVPLYSLFNWLGWHAIVYTYNMANMVVTPTQTAVEYLKDAGLRVPCRAISNGIDLQANSLLVASKKSLRAELKIPGSKVVIYAGRLGIEKHIDVILRAFALVQAKLGATLVLLGDGNARMSLEKLCKELGIAQNVLFLGFVQEIERKKQYLKAADVFAISSPVELQSLVTMEAMAQGLPVLAVRAGALPELCHNGKNGFLFAEGDYTTLAKRMSEVLTDSALAQKLSNASLQIIATHSASKTWQEYEQMYIEIIAKAYK